MSKIRKSGVLIVILGLSMIGQALAAWTPTIRDSMAPKDIQDRIKPIGSVEVDGERAVKDDLMPVALGPGAGKKRYETSCAVCHGAGIAGAPKFQNKADWAPRIGVGIDALLASSIKGKGAMPPRGTCNSCSDEELRLSIEYLLPK